MMEIVRKGNGVAIDLSVVIVSWNTREMLQDCLLSLLKMTGGLCMEIIVVDNASQDGSVEMLRREFPQVEVVVNGENKGFARANNQALQKARGLYALLLNPDTVVLPGLIAKMVQFMKATPQAGVLGCKQIDADGNWQPSCHRMITLRREALVAMGLYNVFPRWIDYGDRPLKSTEPFCVDWVSGACLLLRRDVGERIGFLDEQIFMYAEDTDLCYRIRQLGYSVYFMPDATIVHYRGQSSLQLETFSSAPEDDAKLLRQFRGKRYLLRKHFGHAAAGLYPVVISVEMMRRLMQELFGNLLGRIVASKKRPSSQRSEYWLVLKAVASGKAR